MKKRHVGVGEAESLFDAAERHLKRRKKHLAIGEADNGIDVFYTYERLMKDAAGTAILLSELAHPSDPITVSASPYDTMVVLLAASALSRHVIVSDADKKMTFNGVIITDKSTYSPRFISPAELRTLIAGVLSRGEPYPPAALRGKMEITFRQGEKSDTYSEAALLLSASAFSVGCAITPRDKIVSVFSPHSPDGLFCGMIAPIISGACVSVCPDSKSLLNHLKDLSPTKLFCPDGTAASLLLKHLKIKKKFPVPSHSPEPLSPARLWINRLSHPGISYVLGGKLGAIIAVGELPEASVNALFTLGIYSVMMRSVRGLSPALFRYGGDKLGAWSLPLGATADMHNVQKGGIGNLILSSLGVRMGDPIKNTYAEGEKLSDCSLLTPLKCFIMKNGDVFLVK